MRRMQLQPTLAAALVAVAFATPGCVTAVPPRVDDARLYRDRLGEFADPPRARMGALPFYGLFTLYDRAEIEALGEHSYQRAGLLSQHSEHERGIVYTQRAGFLDIAHIRNSADMTAYIYSRARLAIAEGWPRFQFKGYEPSVYTVSLHYPEGWRDIPEPRRARIIEEIALTLAQRTAFDVMSWHEIITWHGYKSTGILPEKNSAFTYDDIPSHALGVRLAAEAIRSGSDFDQQMTQRLDEVLDMLGAVDPPTQDRAIRAVEGAWWVEPGEPRRRLFDLGTGDGVIEPWVIESLMVDQRHDFRLPPLRAIGGVDLDGFWSVEIDPKVLEAYKLRRVLRTDRRHIHPDTDFPVLVRDIANRAQGEASDPIPDLAVK